MKRRLRLLPYGCASGSSHRFPAVLLGGNVNQQPRPRVFEKASPRSENSRCRLRHDHCRSIWSISAGPKLPDRKPIWKPITKKFWDARFGTVFNKLFTITNQPIARFSETCTNRQSGTRSRSCSPTVSSGDRGGHDVPRHAQRPVTAASFTIATSIRCSTCNCAHPDRSGVICGTSRPEHLSGARSKPASTVLPVPPVLAAVATGACPLSLNYQLRERARRGRSGWRPRQPRWKRACRFTVGSICVSGRKFHILRTCVRPLLVELNGYGSFQLALGVPLRNPNAPKMLPTRSLNPCRVFRSTSFLPSSLRS